MIINVTTARLRTIGIKSTVNITAWYRGRELVKATPTPHISPPLSSSLAFKATNTEMARPKESSLWDWLVKWLKFCTKVEFQEIDFRYSTRDHLGLYKSIQKAACHGTFNSYDLALIISHFFKQYLSCKVLFLFWYVIYMEVMQRAEILFH